MKRIVLTFGLIAGGILSAMMLLTVPFMDSIGFEKGAIIGYTSMVLAFLTDRTRGTRNRLLIA